MSGTNQGSTLQNVLSSRLSGSVVVVGVGNLLCGDDAAGGLVAECLSGTPGVRVIQAEDIPESYLSTILTPTPDVVVFVDAVDMGRPPGTVALLEKESLSRYQPTTHRFPLRSLAKVIQEETGADVFLIAIQPLQAVYGTLPSTEIITSARTLARVIRSVVVDGGVVTLRATPQRAGERPC